MLDPSAEVPSDALAVALSAATLGARLDALLKLRGINRKRLATMTRKSSTPVHRQTISGLCTGLRTDVHLELVRRMAIALRVPPGHLAFGPRARSMVLAPLPPAPATPKMDTLAGRLTWVMKARGVGAAALAKVSEEIRAPISSMGVRGLLRRDGGRASTVERAARVLGISPAWLAFGEGPVSQIPEAL